MAAAGATEDYRNMLHWARSRVVLFAITKRRPSVLRSGQIHAAEIALRTSPVRCRRWRPRRGSTGDRASTHCCNATAPQETGWASAQRPLTATASVAVTAITGGQHTSMECVGSVNGHTDLARRRTRYGGLRTAGCSQSTASKTCRRRQSIKTTPRWQFHAPGRPYMNQNHAGPGYRIDKHQILARWMPVHRD